MLITIITCYIFSLISISFGIITIIFIWGVVKYLGSAGDDTRIQDAKKYLIYSVITFAVILSIWGIVKIASYSLELDHPIPRIMHDSATFITLQGCRI